MSERAIQPNPQDPTNRTSSGVPMNPELPCVDLLPKRASYGRGAGFKLCPCRRHLEINTTSRPSAPARKYGYTELDIDREHFKGRAFQLLKLTAGSDPEAEAYTCLIADDPRMDSCECRGFLRHGHCSHLDSLRGSLANGWLDIPNPMAGPAESSEPTDDELMADYDREIALIDAHYARCRQRHLEAMAEEPPF